jgi:lipoprotein signal peptidase
MEWYWWILIVAGVILIGWLKLKVFKKMTAKKQKKNEED